MGFSEIIGHGKQIEVLRQGLATGRLHHAYLFVGPDGVGKKTVALALAKALHCVQGNADSCGQCRTCVAIERNNHPDVRVLELLAGKKEISIQQVREIENELIYRSFSGGRKIVIIDSASRMNGSAQNALLKTLEEPPQNCLLILIAVQSGGLLPTVRSRCLRLSFASLSRESVSGFLTSKWGKTKEEAEFLAALSLGSLGTARMIETDGLFEKRRAWADRLASLTVGNYRAALEAAETLADSREDTLQFLQWAGSWYRDLLVQAIAQNPQAIVNIDLKSQIRQQSSRADISAWLSLLTKIAQASMRIQRNVNRRMVIEELFISAVERR